MSETCHFCNQEIKDSIILMERDPIEDDGSLDLDELDLDRESHPYHYGCNPSSPARKALDNAKSTLSGLEARISELDEIGCILRSEVKTSPGMRMSEKERLEFYVNEHQKMAKSFAEQTLACSKQKAEMENALAESYAELRKRRATDIDRLRKLALGNPALRIGMEALANEKAADRSSRRVDWMMQAAIIINDFSAAMMEAVRSGDVPWNETRPKASNANPVVVFTEASDHLSRLLYQLRDSKVSRSQFRNVLLKAGMAGYAIARLWWCLQSNAARDEAAYRGAKSAGVRFGRPRIRPRARVKPIAEDAEG